jgi:MFS family permease
MRDLYILLATSFIRATAVSLLGVLLGIYLAEVGFSASQIGYVVGAGLTGTTVASLLAAFFGDHHGRKRMFIEMALLTAAGAAVLCFTNAFWVILSAAFVGMVNGMGRDRGPALVLDQSVLPAYVSDQQRTRAFAYYNVLKDLGHALGSLLAGIPWVLHETANFSTLDGQRTAIGLYTAAMLVTAIAYLGLSSKVEIPPDLSVTGVSPQTRRTLWRISSLFALDSLGSGFFTNALLSYFFFERFGASPGAIGILFFFGRLANACSYFAAAWLAKRIGLLNTMVFTHIPSSLLLVFVAFAPTFPIAAVLFILRETLVEMDVPTRASYVVAVVAPTERTLASGITSLARTAGWAVSPFFAGALMQNVSLATPLFLGAAIKITYDVALFISFRNLRPPEELQNHAGNDKV